MYRFKRGWLRLRQNSCLSAFLLLALCVGSFVDAQISQSFTGIFPEIPQSEYVTIGSASWEQDGYVTVTPGEGNQNGGFFTNAIGSGSYDLLQISFDLRISETSENGGADGYGFVLLPTDTYGSTVAGNNPGFSEEPNVQGAFGLGFDTFDNVPMVNGVEFPQDRIDIDETDPEPATGDRLNESSVSVHWDGQLLGSIWGPSASPAFNFEVPAGETANFNMDLFVEPDGNGNSNLTLTMTNLDTNDVLLPFANLEVPGMDIQDYRIGFRGRTGGAFNKQEVGNVVIIEDGNEIALTLAEPPAPAVLPTLVGGTPVFGLEEAGIEQSSRFSTGRQDGGIGPILQADGVAVGEADGYVSLTQSRGGEQNFITFPTQDNGIRTGFGARTGGSADTYQIDNVEQTSDGTKVVTEFDFRAVVGSRADGFSVYLADAFEYPEDEVPVIGTGTVDGWGIAEDPRLSGIGIGFRTFQNEQVRLRYDGVEYGDEVDGGRPIPVEILNNEWQNAKLTVEAGLGPNDEQGLYVSLILDGLNAEGDPFNGEVFTETARGIFIPGADLGGLVIGGEGPVCDFDGNGSCDLADINNLMYNGLGSADSQFDLNSDGAVDLADRDAWLVAAGSLPGDANLDGVNNAQDLNAVGSHWTPNNTGITSWGDGDYDGNGIVDAGDLNTLGTWWTKTAADFAAPDAAAVPEPSGAGLALLGLVCLHGLRRRR